MALTWHQERGADLYAKFYTAFPLRVQPAGDAWEVYYTIYQMITIRTLHMPLAICDTERAASVKIGEIENYVFHVKQVDK